MTPGDHLSEIKIFIEDCYGEIKLKRIILIFNFVDVPLQKRLQNLSVFLPKKSGHRTYMKNVNTNIWIYPCICST